MQQFHQLIGEERYREARGILETEDLDPRLVEKWRAWLDDLHKEEWQQVAVQNDKLKVSDTRKAQTEMAQMVGGATGALLAGILSVGAVYGVMTTPNMMLMSVFLMIALIIGVTGWLRFGRFLTPDHGTELGAGASVILVLYLLMSGIPFLYYPDGPPLLHWLAGTVLILPMIGYGGWLVGMKIGATIMTVINPPHEESADDERLKKAKSRLDQPDF
ncbi:MAG: hypothetical protein RLP44_04240 [Aggregatilineales bacterium]